MKLWQKALIGILLGILCGILLKDVSYFIGTCYVLQTQFMNLIKLLSGPLIFFTLLNGICNNSQGKNQKGLGSIFIKAFVIFILTTIFAVMIGICFAYIFKPGVGLIVKNEASPIVAIGSSNLISIPDNLISPFLHTYLIQIVILAIMFGYFISMHKAKSKTVISIIEEFNNLFMSTIIYIMEYSYILAFSATTVAIAKHGYEVIFLLSKLISTVVLANIFQYIILLLFIRIFGRISPMPFITKSIPYQVLSFATSSSKASLPKTMEIAEKHMGLSKQKSSLIIPLGSAINMDGTAIYMGVVAIFFSQIHGISLSTSDMISIIITSTFGSIGAAGIPSGSMIVLPSILMSAYIPITYAGILLGVDRLLDMMRTVVNMTGDTAVALIIDSQEKTLDTKTYYSEKKKDL